MKSGLKKCNNLGTSCRGGRLGFGAVSGRGGVGDGSISVVLFHQVTVDVLGNLLRQSRVLRQLVHKCYDLAHEQKHIAPQIRPSG